MNARVRLNEYFPKKDFFYVCVLIKKYKGEESMYVSMYFID